MSGNGKNSTAKSGESLKTNPSLRIRSINQSIQTYRRELRICVRIKVEAPDIQPKIRMLTPAPEKEKKPPSRHCTRPLQR